MTIAEAIHQHKTGVRRVGEGKEYGVSPEAQNLYRAWWIKTTLGTQHLTGFEQNILDEAEGEARGKP